MNAPAIPMSVGIILLNFGEPEVADEDRVTRYVEHIFRANNPIAKHRILGIESYTLGYQNHGSRDVPWTDPAIEDVMRDIDADRVVVDPVSIIPAQSDIPWDLDGEVSDVATDASIEFHRVPIPDDKDRGPVILAELAEPTVAGFDPRVYHLDSCACAVGLNALCLSDSGDG